MSHSEAMRIVALLVLIAGCGSEARVDADERARLVAKGSAWIASARAEPCPRPALRTPVTGDGSALLLGLRDRNSPEGRCLARVSRLRDELAPCAAGRVCALPKLETLKPYPEVLESCAPLYDKISRVAHASEACSPSNLDIGLNDDDAFVLALDHAVRIQIAPLVRTGDLGAAAGHVIDAMRFSDDYGRKAVLIGSMVSVAMTTRLVATLDEILVDPRLATEDARAIARGLDVLLASGPTFGAMVRQEDAWVAKNIEGFAKPEEFVPELLKIEQRARNVSRVCNDMLRACVERLGQVTVDDTLTFTDYARRLGERDFVLTFARMQTELRIAGAEVCADPARRRSLLSKWLASEQASMGEEHEPIVSQPMWQRIKDDRQTRSWALRCVPATL